MTGTPELIARLSGEAAPAKPLRPPAYWAAQLLAVLAVYAGGAQAFLGLRADLAMQLARPLFMAEAGLLLLLAVTGAVACVLSMYPDAYQKPKLLKLPYLLFGLLVALVVSQLPMPHDVRMVMPAAGAHGMECALCIASVALIPTAMIFSLLRKGASIRLLQAGSLAVLTASAIGCLTLRLAEANDSLMHLAAWHYLPTLLFSILGACAGRWWLKW